RGKARSVEQRTNRAGIEAALQMQHADYVRTRACVLHQKRGRSLAAERVIDQPGDCGAVARACEAMRQTPVLEGVRPGAMPRLDVGQNLDAGAEPGGRCHHRPNRIRAAKNAHISSRTTMPTV